jgi:hypothetical protein
MKGCQETALGVDESVQSNLLKSLYPQIEPDPWNSQIYTLYSRFAHFLEHKMNCIPHLRPKNADKTASFPHLGMIAETNVKHFPSKWNLITLQRLETSIFWSDSFELMSN